MTFLKTLLIILLVYYGVKIIFKFAKPYMMRYIAKKATERFGQAFGQNPYQTTSQKEKEGEISIDKSQANTKTSKSTVGDYVDFEELD